MERHRCCTQEACSSELHSSCCRPSSTCSLLSTFDSWTSSSDGRRRAILAPKPPGSPQRALSLESESVCFWTTSELLVRQMLTTTVLTPPCCQGTVGSQKCPDRREQGS